jgi:Acetyl-CoA dehydrogenase C-terminal like
LMGLAQNETPEVFLADATMYLEYFSILVIGWQWLQQAIVVQAALDRGQSGNELNFYQGKMMAFRFFFEYELPKMLGLRARLLSNDRVTLETTAEQLN